MGVILVTGGGTGIGAATALRLAREGHTVVIAGRRPEPLHQLAQQHDSIVPLVADVSNTESTAKLITAIGERFDRLDALVANAGGHGFTTVEDTSDEEWRQSLAVNLDTAFVAARQSLPLLMQSAGSIVIVSSLAGVRAAPATAGYTVGKHALIGLMRSLARDYGTHAVRTNAVCPGWVRTPMADEEMDVLVSEGKASDREAAYAHVTRDVPLGRPAEVDEIAGVISFLLSHDARYINGSTLVVDGGAHIVDVPTLSFG